MEEIFENKILDELYEIREGKVENRYLEKYGEGKVEKRANEAENELVEFMKKFIKEEKNMQEFFDKVNNYELATMSAMCCWYKAYYKVGFIDGISFFTFPMYISSTASSASIFSKQSSRFFDVSICSSFPFLVRITSPALLTNPFI